MRARPSRRADDGSHRHSHGPADPVRIRRRPWSRAHSSAVIASALRAFPDASWAGGPGRRGTAAFDRAFRRRYVGRPIRGSRASRDLGRIESASSGARRQVARSGSRTEAKTEPRAGSDARARSGSGSGSGSGACTCGRARVEGARIEPAGSRPRSRSGSRPHTRARQEEVQGQGQQQGQGQGQRQGKAGGSRQGDPAARGRMPRSGSARPADSA